MPLTLPHLDDRTWEELIEESRRRLSAYAPGWTNHNASDPGITLIELFAYYCESFLFRIDQVSQVNKQAFLKLLGGPGWRSGGDLAEDIQMMVTDLRRPHRAVTPEDFETLAMAVNEQHGVSPAEQVGRAKCVPRSNLERNRSGARSGEAIGHVSVVIVPKSVNAAIEPLLDRVRNAIERVRLIGTRVHVVPAQYVSLGVRIVIVADSRARLEQVRRAALTSLEKFLDPLKGGPAGAGWPFGRAVYVSEIYQLLIRLPGIRSLHRVRDHESGKLADELVLRSPDPARTRRNRLGELEAIELHPSELVHFAPREDEITVTHEAAVSHANREEERSSTS